MEDINININTDTTQVGAPTAASLSSLPSPTGVTLPLPSSSLPPSTVGVAPSPVPVVPVVVQAPPAPVDCTCSHLVSYLSTHSQSSDRRVQALNSVAEWLADAPDGGSGSGSSSLLAVLPRSTQPESELQAIIQLAATIKQNTMHAMDRNEGTHRNCKVPAAASAAASNRQARVGSLMPHCCGTDSSVNGSAAAPCEQKARSLFACIECVNVGCWAPKSVQNPASHARLHAATAQHPLAFDLSRLSLYCFSCNNLVYHPTVETMIKDIKHDAMNRKRRRDQLESVSTTHWPNAMANMFQQHGKWIGSDPLPGLRGMYNLGNTCFMSVVLQSFLCNPLLRNYFLSDLHNPHRCVRRQKIAGVATTPSNAGATNGMVTPANAGGSAASVCLACDLDELFSAFYSGDHSPFVPDHFLVSMWLAADHLAGYAQQDAHELIMALMDGIHEASVEHGLSANALRENTQLAASASVNGSVTPVPRAQSCRCIIHTIFGGTLRSDVRCETCHTSSTALDAILDISLDLVQNNLDLPLAPQANAAAIPQPPLPPPTTSPMSVNDGSAVAPTSTTPPLVSSSVSPATVPGPSSSAPPPAVRGTVWKSFTIAECLQRFTRTEKLFHSDRFFCSRCNSHEDSTKQMSIHSLPLVLCVHLKRFDHSAGVNGSRGMKLENYVSFPLVGLDLSPYLHSSLLSPLSPAGQPRTSPGSAFSVTHRDTLYDLFCVIVHKGTLDTGHYICYVRNGHDWFRGDDRQITKVGKSEVMGCNAYLLFYIKQQVQVR